MNKKGFTLMELLIVLAIISILAAIAISGYIGQQKRAARADGYANLEAFRLLEEQFFAERGRYTASLGVAGSTTAIRDANLVVIQTTAGEALPGFQPGTGSNFSYRTIQNQALQVPVAAPWAGGGQIAQNPCFIAVATGVTGTRVVGDVFVIDCNNNKNF